MLEFTEGDLFDQPADIRVNTVNCVGVMGAGVALAFKQRFPDMFKDYQRACKEGAVRPGRMHVWKSLSGDWIINFPTKRHWRDASRYEDIEAGLDDLLCYLKSVGPVTVALPALGCGHGGLDWQLVSSMIRKKLSDVDARVLVFAPAASHQAGRSASEMPTEEERSEAATLGYRFVDTDDASFLPKAGPIFVKGDETALANKWIALWPSRAPGEKELEVLQSVAAALASSGRVVTVALVHTSRASENIAQTFVENGINSVIVLPFGVLTRKSIAKQMLGCEKAVPTLLSSAPAGAKWSRQSFAQAQDLLRKNAAVMLVSDPEPDWLTSKGMSKWADSPISFVRYESMPLEMRESLTVAGARAIGRRSENGHPNIDHLVRDFAVRSEGTFQSAEEGESRDTTSSEKLKAAAPEGTSTSAKTQVAVDWHMMSWEAKHKLLDTLSTIDAVDITLILSLPPDLSEGDRRTLEALMPISLRSAS